VNAPSPDETWRSRWIAARNEFERISSEITIDRPQLEVEALVATIKRLAITDEVVRERGIAEEYIEAVRGYADDQVPTYGDIIVDLGADGDEFYRVLDEERERVLASLGKEEREEVNNEFWAWVERHAQRRQRLCELRDEINRLAEQRK
jgi:hypothetical protein